MTDRLNWLKKALEEIYDTAKRKNADYCVGEAWSDNFAEFGLYGMLARWHDKVQRVKKLLLGNAPRAVDDETVEDTLMDLATYSLLIMQAHREGMEMFGEIDNPEAPLYKLACERVEVSGYLDIKPRKPLIYLASPYSHQSPAVQKQRFDAACKTAAEIANAGHSLVFSPIAHSHPMTRYGAPGHYDYWLDMDERLLAVCDEVWVLELGGWKESEGIKAEIELAMKLGKRVRYIDP